jgi:hypothetical protein
MTRFSIVTLILIALCAPAAPVQAAGGSYRASLTGSVAAFRLAGVEPDGDPLDQVLLQTTLAPSGSIPRLHLIVDSYLENFTPDTTPILPDLLHPSRSAQNLGGFLQGKALITDDAGDLIATGSFLAEAFLDNSNHAVATLDGSGAGKGSHIQLKGVFTLHKGGAMDGTLFGTVSLTPGARGQLAAHRGKLMRKLKDIINGVSVRPHPMVGKSTKGSSSPYKTGYGSGGSTSAPQPHRTVSPVTIVAGIGAVLSFLSAAVLWWWQRRNPRMPSPSTE